MRLFLKSAFVENLALVFFLGMCTFIAISKDLKTAMGLGVTEFIEGSLDEIDLLGTVSNLLSQFEQRQSNKAA